MAAGQTADTAVEEARAIASAHLAAGYNSMTTYLSDLRHQ